MDVTVSGAFATHQFIDQQACEWLQKSPAFRPDRFPSAARIRLWGVIHETKTGLGPDAAGATPYTWHYYNPDLPAGSQGLAPQKAGDFFDELVEWLILDPRSANAAHHAAWSSHFLADMFVPYHVVGTGVPEIRAIYSAAGGSNSTAVTLTPTIAGNIQQLGANQWFAPTDDFKTSVDRYMAALAADPLSDWFDPWYWNGNVTDYVTGSHLWWEGTKVGHNPPAAITFDPAWVNPAPDFADYRARTAAKVREFAATRARLTRANTVAYWNTPDVAIEAAVSATYTMWRAAFSALRPGIEVKRVTDPQTGKDAYEVRGTVANAETAEAARGVKVRLTVESGGALKSGTAEMALPGGSVAGGGTGECGPWVVESDDPKNCTIRIETIGEFRSTPDLQYAVLTTNISMPEVSNSLVIVLDASGSMSGAKIDNAKAAAAAQVARLDETTEVAVFSFNGKGAVHTIAGFHVPTARGRAALQARIDGIGAGGDTNLAEAIRRAGRYMRGRARGKLRRTLVILSDGEETCGGNPAAEIAALSDMDVRF